MSKLSLENLAPPPPAEPLIVMSKTKAYIKARSEDLLVEGSFNTSDKVEAALSNQVRAILDHAIVLAANDGRKTVMDRDILDATMARASALAGTSKLPPGYVALAVHTDIYRELNLGSYGGVQPIKAP